MAHLPETTGVLFVCLGNICRSPIAEGIFVHMAHQRGVQHRVRIDSAGTGGWHAGELPDPRARAAAKRRGIELVHRARRVDASADFLRTTAPQLQYPGASARAHPGFRWIIAMDRSNRRNLLNLGAPPEHVLLLRSFDPALEGRPDHELEVPDPYEADDRAFDEVYDMAHAACAGLMEHVMREW